MFKRLFAIAAVFIFLVAALPAFAGQLFDAQTAINDALNNSGLYYKQNNKKGNPLNYVSIPILSNYLKGDSYYGCLVYGSPQDVPGNDLKDGQYRYLGRTLNGEDYTNVAFPPDVAHTGYFEDQDWIIRPWRNDDVKANYAINNNNDLDGTDRYAQNIRQGILIYYTDPNNANSYQVRGVNGSTQAFWDNIEQYVHVLAPSTRYAWGIGRMWRYGDGGQINYVTVPLLPSALLDVEVPNLAVYEFESGVPDDITEVGEEYIASAIFVNESEYTSVTGAPVGAWNNGYPTTLFDAYGNTVEKLTLLPGEEKVLAFRFHGQEGMNTLTIAIDTPPLTNLYEETTEEDNTAVIDVGSADFPAPPVNGELSFQAWSKGGYNQYGDYSSPVARPGNTAKLLDDVTATLRPDAPTPPKGELVSWSITSASLTYPRRSPDFSMGAPYPPEGTVTIDMNPDGHEATAEFEEDWAMDGVNADRGAPGIYNILEGRIMAAEKKYYTITADYTIDYTYKWKEKKRKCSTGSDGKRHCHTYYVTRYGSGTTSGAAEGYLLVDGVGRALFAQ